MDLREILDELWEIRCILIEPGEGGRLAGIANLGELIGQLTVQVEAEKAFAAAEAEEPEGAPC